jgi:hypothetical protein
MPKIGKLAKATRAQGAIRAIRQKLSDERPLVLDGVKHDPDEAVAVLERHLAAMARVRELTIERMKAVADERKLDRVAKRIADGVARALKTRLGPRSPALVEFEVKPEKVPYVSSQVKARAVERRRETRKLRGTMGRKQRARIKRGE